MLDKQSIKRISLWSGPRNISTALMYSFAQRSDTKVFDEPLYGFYLQQSAAKDYHPSAREIMKTMENDGEKVVKMMTQSEEKPVLFFKNMTHHLLDLDRAFLEGLYNVILTRDPVEMLPSFAEVIPNPTIDDVGYALHSELVEELKKRNLPVFVVDSKNILLDPKKELNRLCEEIGIPFEEAMLSWEPGARPEDGVWAPHWYKNVHLSAGFQKYKPKDHPFPADLIPLLEACQPHYDNLMKLSG